MTKPHLHRQEIPAYLDKEVSSADRDKFGHAHLADALRCIIEDEKHCPPYSIGLLGKWGTGKSTVKEIYLHDLENDETKSESGIKRRDLIYPITFNAWKYGGEADIRKSLFRHIFLQIDGEPAEADRQLFKTVESSESQRKSCGEIWAEITDYAAGLFIAMLFALLFFALAILMEWVFGFEDRYVTSASILSSVGLIGLLAQKFFPTWRTCRRVSRYT